MSVYPHPETCRTGNRAATRSDAVMALQISSRAGSAKGQELLAHRLGLRALDVDAPSSHHRSPRPARPQVALDTAVSRTVVGLTGWEPHSHGRDAHRRGG